jgi:hypothetical protein
MTLPGTLPGGDEGDQPAVPRPPDSAGAGAGPGTGGPLPLSVLFVVATSHVDLAVMAAALLDRHTTGQVRIHIATTHAEAGAGPIPPPPLGGVVQQAMAEAGLAAPASTATVTRLTAARLAAATVVVWLNPDWQVWQLHDPHSQDWFIDEPADKPLGLVRQLRAALASKASELAVSLLRGD